MKTAVVVVSTGIVLVAGAAILLSAPVATVAGGACSAAGGAAALPAVVEGRSAPGARRDVLVVPETAARSEPPAQVVHGLEIEANWLVRQQSGDGRWEAVVSGEEGLVGGLADRATFACTGAALLTLLGGGSTMRSGPCKASVKNAVVWLRKHQLPSGDFGLEAGVPVPRDHALVTYALCEAVGLSRYTSVRGGVQGALDFLAPLQSFAGDRERVLFLGFKVHAQASGLEFGWRVPRDAITAGLAELEQLRWRVPRLGAAVELACRQVAGAAIPDALVDEVRAESPVWSADFDAEWCFFATQALYRHARSQQRESGPAWSRWATAVEAAVRGTQLVEGPARGSWDPVGPAAVRGGRVYQTAMMNLILFARDRTTRLVR